MTYYTIACGPVNCICSTLFSTSRSSSIYVCVQYVCIGIACVCVHRERVGVFLGFVLSFAISMQARGTDLVMASWPYRKPYLRSPDRWNVSTVQSAAQSPRVHVASGRASGPVSRLESETEPGVSTSEISGSQPLSGARPSSGTFHVRPN